MVRVWNVETMFVWSVPTPPALCAATGSSWMQAPVPPARKTVLHVLQAPVVQHVRKAM